MLHAGTETVFGRIKKGIIILLKTLPPGSCSEDGLTFLKFICESEGKKDG